MRASLHTPYSDPGRFAPLLRALGTDLEAIAAAARNVIGHYRMEMGELADERRGEIDLRWIERTLALDQERHGTPLDAPRPPDRRVAGCCRDHSLLTVAALREQGVPARNRVGFASYFIDDFHPDHVIVEYLPVFAADTAQTQDGDRRWILTDPELAAGDRSFDVRDMATGIGQPFETAAEVWLASRAGEVDASTYGVFPGSELSGQGFIGEYVVFEVAHRYGDELLLWDSWGTDETLDPSDIDELARLLVTADAGDPEAERELHRRYRNDPRLHPGDTITRFSPYGLPPVAESLVR